MRNVPSRKLTFFDQKSVWIKYEDETNRERIKKTITMIPQVSSILEIGCGSGLILNKLSSDLIVGIDLSRAALNEIIHERIVGSGHMLPFKDFSFDMVILAEVLEHLNTKQLEKTLEEVTRVARYYVLVSVPYREMPWETFVKCACCGNSYSPYGHQQFFDEDRIRGLIKSQYQRIEFCGMKKRLLSLKKIMQKFGIYNYRENSICPFCGSKKLKYGIVEKIANNALRLISKFAPSEPNWILCLYKL